MLTRSWFLRGILPLLLLGLGPALLRAEIDLPTLLHNSTSIAVIEIKDAPPLGMSDKAWNPQLAKQQAQATLITLVRGTLPASFIIENETRSVLANGEHLAFLRRVEEGRYILSTPASLRRIRDGQVYWFPRDYVPLDQALAQIK